MAEVKALDLRSDGHPRFVKIVRTGIARFLGSSEVEYRPADPEDALHGLRAKLIEEAVEYLQDPCVDELADVYEVVRALAEADPAIPGLEAVIGEANAKRAERGGFDERYGMYVTSTAQPRHEGRHAA